ncbi:MAG TPA: proton-conducting transporter membrane subunit, partial [Candidatus Aminicenantes bacterium]|nr:proton-conducting transporter membrane subunit [Candidatus Aminicenantes bacterium]
MLLFRLALGFFFLGALVSLISWRRPAWARIFAPVTVILGSLLAMPPVLSALLGKEVPLLELPWSLPFGSLTMRLDPLSALFALTILVVSALAALYGIGYFSPIPKRGNLSLYWFNFSTLVVSMLVVITARNGLLFLLAWELMSLSSFFLVLFEKDDAMVRRAGWTYLIATHIGTAFLLVFFLLLGARSGGTLEFGAFKGSVLLPGTAGVAFLLALVGFGTKAGFMPLHVWLPEAHPAAPSNVSALMSGVMIKTGIYGLVRSLTFLGTPAPWWGWVLLAVGAFSGILGVLFALAQHDLKRLLAYHSVENIGIIALGIGLGVFGLSCHNPLLIYLGFAGGLFHVVNHALFKSLLFLGAGSVLHSAGTREIDILGGLLKRMPTTGTTFLIGSVAICGLPPLNGFASEFMIYLAS